MRIMQVCTNFLPGGIQRHVLDLTADLRGRGHQVTLAGDQGDWGGDALGDHLALGLGAVAGTGGAVWRRVAALWPAVRTLRRAIRVRRVELVHAHETTPLLVAWLATLGLNIPVVMTFHGSAPEREASVARLAGWCADLTISPSRTSLEALIGKGLARARTAHIELGIAPMPPVAAGEVAALRQALLGPKGQVLILSLSRLQPQKGIDVMIEVARQVCAARPDVVFAIAGKGPQRAAAEGWAETAGVADKVRFLGAISTVPQHLAASDLFLLTSRWEALPISIVEAFRARLPVIATDCGGVKELVDDPVGALLPVGDAAGIAAAVLALVNDPALRRQKGAAALARSGEDRFDPAMVHARFEATYARLIAARG